MSPFLRLGTSHLIFPLILSPTVKKKNNNIFSCEFDPEGPAELLSSGHCRKNKQEDFLSSFQTEDPRESDRKNAGTQSVLLHLFISMEQKGP